MPRLGMPWTAVWQPFLWQLSARLTWLQLQRGCRKFFWQLPATSVWFRQPSARALGRFTQPPVALAADGALAALLIELAAVLLSSRFGTRPRRLAAPSTSSASFLMMRIMP